MKKDTGMIRTSVEIELDIAELCLRQLQTCVANRDEKTFDESVKMLIAHLKIARASLREYIDPEEEQDDVPDNGIVVRTESAYEKTIRYE